MSLLGRSKDNAIILSLLESPTEPSVRGNRRNSGPANSQRLNLQLINAAV
jgi:hypothetical protein